MGQGEKVEVKSEIQTNPNPIFHSVHLKTKTWWPRKKKGKTFLGTAYTWQLLERRINKTAPVIILVFYVCLLQLAKQFTMDRYCLCAWVNVFCMGTSIFNVGGRITVRLGHITRPAPRVTSRMGSLRIRVQLFVSVIMQGWGGFLDACTALGFDCHAGPGS